jgi:hypothetical protein
MFHSRSFYENRGRIRIFKNIILGFGIVIITSVPAIDEAVQNGDLAKVKAMLKADPSLVFSRATDSDPYTPDYGGWTPLHYAAAYGHKDIAELLLSEKADINSVSDHYKMCSRQFRCSGFPQFKPLSFHTHDFCSETDIRPELKIFCSFSQGRERVPKMLPVLASCCHLVVSCVAS